ncbi:MAG TPA: GNAT family N-acetyltransferase [Puia sp.]|nr:GNAT family N-acetyltransferase [Puia sp.]
MTAVRKATISDLSQLSRLFDLYRVFYRKESDLDAAESFLRERMERKESIVFVAEEDEQLLGFTQLYPQFSSTRMKRTWLLNDLYVLEAQRGRGISRQLIAAAMELARDTGAAGLLLETEKKNMIGNNLYPSAGFRLYDDANFYWWENTGE